MRENRNSIRRGFHRPGMAVVLSSWVAIAGCQSYYTEHIFGNESSTHFTVPVDSIFELERAVTVSENRSRVFFQGGRAIELGKVDRYSAYCWLELASRKPAPQVVEPDRFVVRAVRREYRYQLADAARFIRVGQLDNGSGTDYLVVATILELYSSEQPDVLRLVCANWGLPQDRSNISIEVIRAVLDGFFTLNWTTALRIPVDPRTVRRTYDDLNAY
ncbi:MAG: hypothetical protein OES09_10265 [Gammaproteobacteria bacterium]|nr:hypothetical protein [Gammaproteobacteria bacterium]